MKKAVKYAAIGIGVIIVLALAIPFLIPTETYKKLIISQVESKISGSLEIGAMRVRLLPLPGFTLKNVKLTNTGGRFGGQPIVVAGEISGGLALRPLLKKAVVASLKLDRPEVYYRSARDGRTNVDDLMVEPVQKQVLDPRFRGDDGRGSKGEGVRNSSPPSVKMVVPGTPPFVKGGRGDLSWLISTAYAATPKTASRWNIMISGFDISDGIIQMSTEKEAPFEIKRLDFKLSNFSPTDKKAVAPVKLAAAILGSGRQNFKIDGKISLDLEKKTAAAKGWNLWFDGMSFLLDANVNYSNGVALAGHLESKKIEYLGYEVADLKSNFRFAGDRFNLDSLSANLYGGEVEGKGAFIMGKEPSYETDVAITSVDMAKVPATKDILRGLGTMKVALEGKGTTPAAIKKNLRANGNIHLDDGSIPSLKLGEKIFGNSAWNILAKAGVGLNQQELQELRGLDASCKDFDLVFKVEDGVVTTPTVRWQHQKYRVNLSGAVTMEEKLKYNGEFALLPQATGTLLTNQAARNILTNKSGELPIPFDVSGTVQSPNVSPDEKYLGTLFARAVNELVAKKAKEVVQQKIAPAAKEAGKKILQGIFGK